MSILSSPNRVVCEYFVSLRRLAEEAKKAPSQELCRQSAALAVIMAVTVSEVFMNLWFRVRIEERHSVAEREAFLKELSFPRPVSLDRKLRKWPERYLGGSIDVSSGPGAEFIKLKSLRNSIVHFTSNHESIELEGVAIHGLANTTDYDGLGYEQANWALQTAENFVAEIFRKSGVSEENIRHGLHAWTGKGPV